MNNIKYLVVIFFVVIVLCMQPKQALSGFFEASTGWNYQRSEYSANSYSWERRYGFSLGYNFGDQSVIEFAFQDSYTKNRIENFEDSTYHDQVYSVNWVQNILSREHIVQPYFKLGVGQLNREATVVDSLNRSQVIEQDSLTAVIGVGMRIFLTKRFAIRGEGTSYLNGAKLRTWRDNFGLTAGVSLFF